MLSVLCCDVLGAQKLDKNCSLMSLEVLCVSARESVCSSKTFGTASYYLFKDLCCPLLMAVQWNQTNLPTYTVSAKHYRMEMETFILINLLPAQLNEYHIVSWLSRTAIRYNCCIYVKFIVLFSAKLNVSCHLGISILHIFFFLNPGSFFIYE